MPKSGPKKGISRWQWYVIKRVRDGKYYIGAVHKSYRFGSLDDARSWRVKPAFSMLCRIRRQHRLRERCRIQGRDGQKRQLRATPKPPETFILEVKGNPRAEVRYPWPMPM